MIKILFVCHGNICRSPMAEFIFKKTVKQNGEENQFEIASAATSREEIGNDLYPPAKRVLFDHGIPFEKRAARQITKADLAHFDHVILMDRNNLFNLRRLLGEDCLSKAHLLMDFTNHPGDVDDPWYTDDFETAYQRITEGCLALYKKIKEEL